MVETKPDLDNLAWRYADDEDYEATDSVVPNVRPADVPNNTDKEAMNTSNPVTTKPVISEQVSVMTSHEGGTAII